VANGSLKQCEGLEFTSAVEQKIQSYFKKPIYVDGVKVAKLEDYPHNGYARDIVISVDPSNPNSPNVGTKHYHVGTIFLKKVNSETVGEIEEITLYPVASNFLVKHDLG
jgi:hypothetical protein